MVPVTIYKVSVSGVYRGYVGMDTHWCVFTTALRLISPLVMAALTTGATLRDNDQHHI
jgi:hypothetical protein